MNDIDISPEAVERLAVSLDNFINIVGFKHHSCNEAKALRALSAALSQSKVDYAFLEGQWAGCQDLLSKSKEFNFAFDEVAGLRDALTQSRAETAAAYERAAMVLDSEALSLEADASRFRGGTDPHHYRMNFASAARRQSSAIRALTSSDQSAALAAIVSAAEDRGYEAGMMEAAAVARDTPTCLLPSGHFLSERCSNAILSAIPKGQMK